MPGGKNYRYSMRIYRYSMRIYKYSMRIYKYSMGFRIPVWTNQIAVFVTTMI